MWSQQFLVPVPRRHCCPVLQRAEGLSLKESVGKLGGGEVAFPSWVLLLESYSLLIRSETSDVDSKYPKMQKRECASGRVTEKVSLGLTL